MERLAEILSENDIEVYLPHRDSGLLKSNLDSNSTNVFEGNIKGIIESDTILALLNGSEVDSGVAWELGYAYSLGKEIICVSDDIRINDNTLNLMIYKSCNKIIYLYDYVNINELVEKILYELRKHSKERRRGDYDG